MSKIEKRVLDEMPESLIDHIKWHGSDFETLMITFQADGTWYLTGFGGEVFFSLETVAEVLGEASKMIGTEHSGRTIH